MILFAITFIFKNQNEPNSQTNSTPSENSSESNGSENTLPTGADKVIVAHFHGNDQCWSCITVGKLALETIKEKFPEEYDNGLIEFKEINGELPENQAMVIKYQARGSSLFINAIKDNQDYIQEDTNVWRLVMNEDQFKLYLENKLRNILSK